MSIVTGTYEDATGSRAEGLVSFIPTSSVVDGEVLRTKSTVKVRLVDGEFSTHLQDTESTMPKDWTYTVVEHFPGGRTFSIKVPPGNHNLADLAPVDNSPGFGGFAPADKRPASDDATDLATAIDLVNALKSDLIALGLKSSD